MSEKENQELARKRAMVIMKVRSGQITAQEGANLLGVSRNTYYEWEKKGLQGMVDNLKNESSGRPSFPPKNPEKKALEEENKALKKKLLIAEQTVEVRDLLEEYERVIERDFKVPKQEKIERINVFLELLNFVIPKSKIFEIKEDPADNIVLEAALEAKVDFIISGDKHLLKKKNFKGIKIISPKEFLEKLK